MNKNPQYSLKSSQKLKVSIFLILSFLFCQSIISQNITWQHSYLMSNWTTGNSIKQTTDGNFIVCGLRDGYSGFVAKLNSKGDTLWVKYLPVFELNSIIETNDGNYVVVGGTGNLYVAKLNQNGIIIWTRSINETGFSVLPTHINNLTDGGFIISGILDGAIDYGYLLKIDTFGIRVWSSYIGLSTDDQGLNYVKQTSDNNYITTGYKRIGGNISQIYLVKTDSQGNVIWEKNYGTVSYHESGTAIFQLHDLGYLIISGIAYTNQITKLYFVKTDSAGNLQWSKIYGDTMTYFGTRSSDCAVKVNYNNSYVITGVKVECPQKNGQKIKSDCLTAVAVLSFQIAQEKDNLV